MWQPRSRSYLAKWINTGNDETPTKFEYRRRLNMALFKSKPRGKADDEGHPLTSAQIILCGGQFYLRCHFRTSTGLGQRDLPVTETFARDFRDHALEQRGECLYIQ